MAIKTKEEILAALNAKFGEDSSDETLAIIEDVSDTLDDYDEKTKETTNWKEKYEENDAAWRSKYRERFFDSGDDRDDNDGPVDDIIEDLRKDEDKRPKTFEELFITEE